MSNPQQPELARSRKTPAQDPDATAGVLDGQREPSADAPRGPVPPDNQPGHHPAKEQDKPDLNAFADRLGVGDGDATPGADKPLTERVTEQVSHVTERVKGGRTSLVGVAGAVTTLLAVILAFVVKRRRSRR